MPENTCIWCFHAVIDILQAFVFLSWICRALKTDMANCIWRDPSKECIAYFAIICRISLINKAYQAKIWQPEDNSIYWGDRLFYCNKCFIVAFWIFQINSPLFWNYSNFCASSPLNAVLAEIKGRIIKLATISQEVE